ncbi:hypothetical protein Patl1_24031 [Pistacia atlantica]|uniref:Uncharacterized protein n=1 Tax=Pistacia atlantica TaxID=434234 RepID=A0ACC0ZZZ5_9ROSI|nr:hypothetical protein Patl1_24031 [Pistacia atlantica]
MSLLHLQVSSSSAVRSPPCLPYKYHTTVTNASSTHSSFPSSSKSSKSSSLAVASSSTKHQLNNGSSFRVRSSLDTVEPTVGQVTEVDKDTFWPIVKGRRRQDGCSRYVHPVVFTYGITCGLLAYSLWGRCGPCKVMAPKYQELSEKYSDVVFLKLDCNQENKPLAKELGIRVVPTFKILKDNKVVKEVTGAKFDDLVVAIENVRSS